MSSVNPSVRRTTLLRELPRLGRQLLFGTLSETYRRCGRPTCACQQRGPKHGPHLQVSYRSEAGKTAGYHVPDALHDEVRAGVAAWQRFQAAARELAALNRARVWAPHQQRRAR
jgi:hypothetical protein